MGQIPRETQPQRGEWSFSVNIIPFNIETMSLRLDPRVLVVHVRHCCLHTCILSGRIGHCTMDRASVSRTLLGWDGTHTTGALLLLGVHFFLRPQVWRSPGRNASFGLQLCARFSKTLFLA